MVETVILSIVFGFLFLCLFAVIGSFLFDDIRFIWSPFQDRDDPKFSYKEYKALDGKLKGRYPTICGKYVRLSPIDYFKVYQEEKRNNQLQARAAIIEEATRKK